MGRTPGKLVPNMKLRNKIQIGWVFVFGLTICGGCSRDTRLDDRKVRHATTKSVTHYGMTLGETATPKQVAYVLLRAIRDDFLASTSVEREAALDKLFDICAADVIEAKNPTAISRDEYIHNVVYRWTPTVSHYVNDFETDWERAAERFVVAFTPTEGASGDDSTMCDVLIELEDPSGDPNAHAVMVIHLVKDGGFWRVLFLGFDATRRAIES